MTDSMAASAPVGGKAFSVGGVLKRSFSTYFANFVPFSVLALIFYLPSLIYGLATLHDLQGGTVGTNTDRDIIIGILSSILTYILFGALVYGTVRHLSGENTSLGAIVSRGMSTVGSVFVIAILFSLIVGIGFALFIIPGVILLVVYAVVIPAAVVERPGIFGSFKRSSELTKGNRWRVFGVLLILFVIVIVFSVVVFGVAALAALPSSNLTLLAVVNYLVSAILGALLSVATAVLYHDLRVAKEGISTAQIAAVFD